MIVRVKPGSGRFRKRRKFPDIQQGTGGETEAGPYFREIRRGSFRVERYSRKGRGSKESDRKRPTGGKKSMLGDS